MLDALRGGIFPLKTTNIHLMIMKKKLRKKPSTTASIIEDISDMSQYRIPFRAKEPLIYVGTPVKIDVSKSTTKREGLKLPLKQMLHRLLILLAQVLLLQFF